MISKKLEEALLDQLNYEFYSAYFYISIASYFASINLEGFESFMLSQVEEEQFHTMKFYEYLKERKLRIQFKGIEKPKSDFKSLEDAFSEALKHEQSITKRIYHLMDIAVEEREHATVSFLKWFLDEQVEEESHFDSWLQKIKMVSDNNSALWMLDKEAGQRTFTPPEKV
ncbi:MAG: ferritin [Spirochaetota bacterium]|nr:ferritin [Spirochaetota bacterium]